MQQRNLGNRDTIGKIGNTYGTPKGKILFQAIEIILGATQGKTVFQNLTQLDGAIITNIGLITPKVSGYSAQTYNSNIPTLADLKAMFFTFQKDNIQVLENIPALTLNPYMDNDGSTATTITSNNYWEMLFSPQPIDFNKSYVWMANAPSTANIVVSLGISYFYP